MAPYSGTVTGWRIYAQQTGTLQFDIGSCANAGFASFTSIVGAVAPALASADHALSAGLTGWTLGITAGHIFRFTLSSVSGIQKATIVLDYSRP